MLCRVASTYLRVSESFPQATVAFPQILVGHHGQPREPGQRRRGPPRPRKVRGEDRVWPKRGEQPCGSFGLLLADRIERDVALALKSPLHVPRGLAVPPENQPD